MTSQAAPTHVQLPRWLAIAALALLSLGSSISCLPNGWVQDDLLIIGSSPALHSLAHPWGFFIRGYWPPPFPPDLYRPLTSLSLAAEWVVGAGRPMVLHATSILLYLVVILLVYRFARRLVNTTVAWVAAAWFAVHPVHVEDVAVAVNQAELIVAIVILVAMTAYIDRRRSGRLTSRSTLGIAALYVVGMLCKEHALMLPGFMLAAELTVLDDPRPWRDKWGELQPLVLALVLAAFAMFVARDLALHGNTKGSFTAEALTGLGIGGRALTMLGVVPEWVRLFFWPEHLRADYSPQVIVAATHWGMMQTLGALILVTTVWIASISRHRWPVVTFGILWIGVALFPVSNVLVPAGIVLAERTLFLATVGLVLAASGTIVAIGRSIYALGSIGRIATALATAVLLGMGLSRSFSRQMVWHDQTTFWFQTLIDAPNSYRAHHAFAEILFSAGAQRSAEYHYRRAMQLYPLAWPVDLELADRYRAAGDCFAAISLYHQVLLIVPDHPAARGSLIACLLYTGAYPAAIYEARLGASYGRQPKTFALYGHIADSAAQAHAPPRTVKLPAPIDSAAP